MPSAEPDPSDRSGDARALSRWPFPYLKIALRPSLTEAGSTSGPAAQATVANAKAIAANATSRPILILMVASSGAVLNAGRFELGSRIQMSS
jgi:hypothetical protein